MAQGRPGPMALGNLRSLQKAGFRWDREAKPNVDPPWADSRTISGIKCICFSFPEAQWFRFWSIPTLTHLAVANRAGRGGILRCVPCTRTVLKAACVWAHFILPWLLWRSNTMVSILQMKKRRHRKVGWPAEGHRANWSRGGAPQRMLLPKGASARPRHGLCVVPDGRDLLCRNSRARDGAGHVPPLCFHHWCVSEDPLLKSFIDYYRYTDPLANLKGSKGWNREGRLPPSFLSVFVSSLGVRVHAGQQPRSGDHTHMPFCLRTVLFLIFSLNNVFWSLCSIWSTHRPILPILRAT